MATAAARVHGVATLADAGTGQLAFLANPRYRSQLADSQASASSCCAQEDAAAAPRTALIATDPYTTFAKIAALFEPATRARSRASTPAPWSIPAPASPPAPSIGPFVVIGAGSRIGDGCVIGAGLRDRRGLRRRRRQRTRSRASPWSTRVRLGQRVRIHPGAVLGADGFGLAMDAGRWIKVPQLGGVVIGDDCEIGANTTIDRGAMDDTVLEEDVRLDNQIQIGHNVRIGAHTAMAGCTAVGRQREDRPLLPDRRRVRACSGTWRSATRSRSPRCRWSPIRSANPANIPRARR